MVEYEETACLSISSKSSHSKEAEISPLTREQALLTILFVIRLDLDQGGDGFDFASGDNRDSTARPILFVEVPA